MRISGGQVFDLKEGFVSRDVCFTLDQLRDAGVRVVIWPNGLWMRWWSCYPIPKR